MPSAVKGSTAHTGTVDIVADKTLYQLGETAKMLITFPEPIDEALLTLERDRVEQQSLLSHPANWLTLQRLNDTQYEARVPVSNSFAPNITFFRCCIPVTVSTVFRTPGSKLPFPSWISG